MSWFPFITHSCFPPLPKRVGVACYSWHPLLSVASAKDRCDYLSIKLHSGPRTLEIPLKL